MIAAASALVALGWVVIGPVLAAAVTLLANRLLGSSRGWVKLLGAGLVGWTAGVLIAGALTAWQWSTFAMVALAVLFGTLMTMIAAVGIDLLASPGSLPRDGSAGRLAFRRPGAAWRATVAPLSRYRQLVSIARSNGLSGHRMVHADRLVEAGPAVRHTLEQAGGMFVKLGQVASTRSDLLPADLCDELAKLRSSAEPATADAVRPELEAELGSPVEAVFSEFDWSPLAAASIAQVYAAVLPGEGGQVIVKVQRPGLDIVIDRDAAAVMQLASAAERFTTIGLTMRPTELAAEFVAGVREELDFRAEAANAAVLAAATPAETGVRVPTVHTRLSTRKVLVEERVIGTPISDVVRLRELGFDPSALADRLLRVMLTHMFESGTFHADPHPGNILVESDGTIVLIDLGAVGHLGRGQRTTMIELLAAMSRADAGAVRDALESAGVLDGAGDLTGLGTAIDEFLARHLTVGGGIDSSLFEDLLRLLATFSLQPPRWMATVGRTMVTLEGTLRLVDPDFSLVDAAQQLAHERVSGMTHPTSLRSSIEAEAMAQMTRLRRLPARVDAVLGQAARGTLSARVSLLASPRDLADVTRLVNRLVLGIVVAALGIGSVMLLGITSGPTVPGSVSVNEILGYGGIAVAAVLLLRLVAAIVRDGRA